jgi:hypothetical protein
MKTKKIISVALILLIGVVVGGIAGASISSYFLFSFFNSDSIMQDVASIKQHVAALQKIRERDIAGATEVLETALDSTLIRFSVDLKSPGEPHEAVDNALKAAKAYRTKYPRNTKYPEIDEAVAKALSKVNQ